MTSTFVKFADDTTMYCTNCSHCDQNIISTNVEKDIENIVKWFKGKPYHSEHEEKLENL